MSFILNEYDVQAALNTFDPHEQPNLYDAARSLSILVDWTNSNSDGWPYWRKPQQASKRLQTALYQARLCFIREGEVTDLTDAELKSLYSPIKAFRTRVRGDFKLIGE